MTLILGIESSCDETAAGVVRDGRIALSNVIASQHDLHAEYGGVVPEIASRAHLERIVPVVRAAMRQAGAALDDLDTVAVGHRPGLIGALLVGVAAAKALAWSLGKPLIGVDHVHAHLYAPLLRWPAHAQEQSSPGGAEAPPGVYPALGLVVSGGHTSMYRCESPIAVRRLGSTIDDAIGEAFDKVAAMLGLPHPGGPAVDRLASEGDDRAHDFPVSRLDADSLNFSYSGVKTAVLYTVRGAPTRDAGAARFERDHADLTERQRRDIAASFQRAAVDAVMLKLARAIERQPRRGRYRSLLVGGGVSANTRLRASLEDFARRHDLPLRLPSMEFCLDNAAMIAGVAHHRLLDGHVDDLTLAASPAGG